MKNELTQVLTKYTEGKLPFYGPVTTLEWRLEKATETTAVMYFLRDGAQAEHALMARIQNNKPSLLILSRKPDSKLDIPIAIIKEDCWNQAVSACCDIFYPIPQKINFAAVTGTNGKTTTVDLVLQMCESSGLKGISIGTLGVRSQGKTLEEFGLTTPGLIELRKIVTQYGKNLDFIIMEASSHAIDQGRLTGIEFVSAAWTSFSQDHLDYHKTLDEYFKSKSRIVNYLKPHGKLFIASSQHELKEKLKHIPDLSIATEINPIIKSKLPVFFGARFNLDNLECAREIALTLGAEENKIQWDQLLPPPGRFHVTQWKNRMAIVDFAHTPDALENICKAVKESYPTKKLVVLFGCGGDRDKGKRPLMGQAAAHWADKIILTSDNPRSENPDQIILDIEKGVVGFKELIKEADRPTALQAALKNLNENEILLVAGKGHEEYIQVGKVKIPYSDQGEIDKYLKGLSHG